MSATGLVSTPQPLTGVRPIHPRRDLAAIADLIEQCFASNLDASGYAAIQEMRMLSRAGPLLGVLTRLNMLLPLVRGFVWIEHGRLVGNISVSPVGYDRGWIIANVAVDPDYRRRGIARQLVHAALDLVRQQGAFVTLQVDATNEAACALYTDLGFQTQRTFTRWRRVGYRQDEANPPLHMPALRRLARREAPQLYTLAEHVRPNSRGGMGWLRPTKRDDFCPPRWRAWQFFWSDQRSDFWGVPGANGAIDAVLSVRYRVGGLATVFDLLVHPEHQGQFEAGLIHFLLNHLRRQRQPLITDHPADDHRTSDELRQNHFKAERTLEHMHWSVPPGSSPD